MSTKWDTADLEVKPNTINAIVYIGPSCLGFGVYIQNIHTSTNHKLQYSTKQIIIMIPFISLTLQTYKIA